MEPHNTMKPHPHLVCRVILMLLSPPVERYRPPLVEAATPGPRCAVANASRSIRPQSSPCLASSLVQVHMGFTGRGSIPSHARAPSQPAWLGLHH